MGQQVDHRRGGRAERGQLIDLFGCQIAAVTLRGARKAHAVTRMAWDATIPDGVFHYAGEYATLYRRIS